MDIFIEGIIDNAVFVILFGVFVLLAIISLSKYTLFGEGSPSLWDKRVRNIPYASVFLSIGIIGTFWGIYEGLLEFDTNNINESVPSLLDGLKTSFFTSIVGLILALIYKICFSIFTTSITEEKNVVEGVKKSLETLNESIKSLDGSVVSCKNEFSKMLNDFDSKDK